MSPRLLDGAGGIMFLCRLSVRACMRPSVRDVVSAVSLVCVDGFRETFVSSASWDKDELIRSRS